MVATAVIRLLASRLRALKALERDGAIKVERARILVLDPNVLGRWSGSTAFHAP